MKVNDILRTVGFFILLTLPGCDKQVEEEEKTQMTEKYDISGMWSLYAWFPLDCPDCTEYRYNITRGDLIFDMNEYALNLHYTFCNQADSLIEMGTFFYSSEYYPPDQYNQIIFRNFNLKNDTTMVMLYWLR